MTKMKRFGLMLLTLTMSVSMLAACGSKDAKDSNTSTPANNDAAATDAKADTSPITFSFFGADASPNWNKMQDEVGKVITEKTGVTINAEYAVGDPGQKLSLIVASGEYPDLVFAKGDANKFVDAGAFIDLTDLIDKYAPNLQKLYGKYMNRLKWDNEDQSIYVIPTLNAVGQTYFDTGGTFQIQHQVLKELGYPEIKTVKDYENAIKAYAEKHKTIDGQPTIPLTLNADDWRIMISVTNPAFQSTGASDDGEYYIDIDTEKAELHYKRPQEKEYFRWLNHMNDSGLLDKEAFVQKTDQYEAKISSGRVLGLIDQDWGFGNASAALKSAGKYDQTYARFPVQVDGTTKDATFQPTGYSAGLGIGITTACKDPVRAIKFLDWLASDEGQVLLNWGIEGKHYTVENGKRVINPEVQDRKVNDNANFTKETGLGGLYNAIAPRYGDGVKDATDNYYTTNFPESIQNGYTAADKATLAAYGVQTYKDMWPKPEEFKEKPWGAAYNMQVPSDSDVNIIYNKLTEIIRKRIPEIILAKPADFDTKYDAFLAELDKNGAQKMEAGYTELIKQRVALFNS